MHPLYSEWASFFNCPLPNPNSPFSFSRLALDQPPFKNHWLDKLTETVSVCFWTNWFLWLSGGREDKYITCTVKNVWWRASLPHTFGCISIIYHCALFVDVKCTDPSVYACAEIKWIWVSIVEGNLREGLYSLIVVYFLQWDFQCSHHLLHTEIPFNNETITVSIIDNFILINSQIYLYCECCFSSSCGLELVDLGL